MDDVPAATRARRQSLPAGPASRVAAGGVSVLAPNLKRRPTGVTTTIVTLVPLQARQISIAAVGMGLPERVPRVPVREVLLYGRSVPPGRPCRIWHARRNNEMLAGVVLKRLLGQKLKLVFTSAAQRKHTRWTDFLLRQMDAVIATSPGAAKVLDVPSHVILHGVDTTRFSPPADRAKAWHETGLPGRFAIAVAGRVRPQKGNDLFVEAMCRILPDHPEWMAIMLGRVTRQNQAYADGLRQRIAEARLSDRILFLGEVPEATVPHWYSAISIFVSPQRDEGFGLAPLEAMASGVPVVATRVGAFPLTVVDGETGFLVNGGDAVALESPIRQLMADGALREQMGKVARQHVMRNHRAENEALRINLVYERLWQQAEREQS